MTGPSLVLGALVLALGGCSAPPPEEGSSADEHSPAARRSPGKARATASSPTDRFTTAPPQPVAAPTLRLRSAKAAVLEPVRARPATCAQPPGRADDFRVAGKAPAWEGLALDKDDAHAEPIGVEASADGTIWTVHDSSGRGFKPGYLRRWDGSAWRTFDIPAVPFSGPFAPHSNPHTVQDVAVGPDGRVRVFGSPPYAHKSSGPALFVHTLDKERWRSEVFPLTATASPVAMDAHGPWVRYGERALRWTGSVWRSYRFPAARSGVPSYSTPETGSMFQGPNGEMWGVTGSRDDGNGRRVGLLRWEGTGWREIGLPRMGDPGRGVLPAGERLVETSLKVNDMAVLGADDVWVVGAAAMLAETGEDEVVDFRPVALHWDGVAWSCHWGLGPAAKGGNERFNHIESDGAGGMWLVNDTEELWHLSGGRWTRGRLPGFDGCVGSSVNVTDLVLRPGTREVYALGTHHCGRVDRPALWRTR
ncbi:hypothetical protein ACFFMN_31620 [Planobispora siamensis]|uniref:Uncharacterized protein n=1 Tax=Planobispora siamensis TaxID=936338 RepID=A0A8J3SP17_9ACTN|nr:hypothetical protein [Planobispora siamensis]GIH97946.1 hypothetical protein Psi01_85760 [Planobispora siamensis]